MTEKWYDPLTLFWKDKWLRGQRFADLATQIFPLVPTRRANTTTVLDALTDDCWVQDIQGATSVGVLVESQRLGCHV